ncbi:hypothetical protein [Curtobacterium oceanosedimentum]|uniref:Uncharacterized protein n=1 Tax=Curtobacterium oceanosedimentum TaxID=465820 RepID=A0A147DLU7_9MICO|nr:hypothetical protein [Curtobacterium oceanosedimentum]KTR46310.1 hypothetical protein NS359_15710 [Curtobacterium oceanosedimentum]
MSQQRRRPAVTVVAAVIAAGLVAGGFALTAQRNGEDPVIAGSAASVTPSATAADGAVRDGAARDGVVTIERTGPDLPGSDVLGRCDTDRRAVVARYETAALGRVELQCGTSGQGYEHIRVRHTADWQDVVRGHGSRDWDDAMLTAVRSVLESPPAGYPQDAGDGKVCYAAPVRFDDGTRPSAEPNVRVIVSETTDRVITAFPTDDGGC